MTVQQDVDWSVITAMTNIDDLDTGNRVLSEKVDKFCYLGDTMNTRGKGVIQL